MVSQKITLPPLPPHSKIHPDNLILNKILEIPLKNDWIYVELQRKLEIIYFYAWKFKMRQFMFRVMGSNHEEYEAWWSIMKSASWHVAKVQLWLNSSRFLHGASLRQPFVSWRFTPPCVPKGVLANTKTILLEDCFLLPIAPDFWMSFNITYTRVKKTWKYFSQKSPSF